MVEITITNSDDTSAYRCETAMKACRFLNAFLKPTIGEDTTIGIKTLTPRYVVMCMIRNSERWLASTDLDIYPSYDIDSAMTFPTLDEAVSWAETAMLMKDVSYAFPRLI